MASRALMYGKPLFLPGVVTQETYGRWLQHRARAHCTRDRKRSNREACVADYKRAIHDAVIASQGRDAYTGEILDWHLIGTYDNLRSASETRAYKHRHAALAPIPP